MEYSFTCYGHENITCRHKATLEFTKDSELSLKGDCIVGVEADFSIKEIKRFVESLGHNKMITIIMETINNNYNNKIINNKKNIESNDYKNKKNIEKIYAEINPGFDSDKEMVIRKTDFIDKRTFAIKADKAAFELDKGLIRNIANNKQKISVLMY